MNRSRKIQIALGAILLWSSTAVSSLAATNTNPGKNQSNTVNLPVESIPSSQLNLTPDTNLIAGEQRDHFSSIDPDAKQIFSELDNRWNEPERNRLIMTYCDTELKRFFPRLDMLDCLKLMMVWLRDKIDYENYSSDEELELLTAMRNAVAEKWYELDQMIPNFSPF